MRLAQLESARLGEILALDAARARDGLSSNREAMSAVYSFTAPVVLKLLVLLIGPNICEDHQKVSAAGASWR